VTVAQLTFCREESSLFQPGAEVFLENQHSLLETVQDLVQHDIVESGLDGKQYGVLQEDPLNVMEPRPSKNLSEESLLRTAKTYGDVYEMILETNKRVDALEQRLAGLLSNSLGTLAKSFLSSPLTRRVAQALGIAVSLVLILKKMYHYRK
jgi:hypothetical protein